MTKQTILKISLFIFLAFVLLVLGILLWWWNSASFPQPAEVEIVSNANSNQISNKITDSPSNKKVVKDEELQTQTDALLPLFGKMPQVLVYIKDEPILKSGSETQKGVAYTSCQNKNEPTIFVKKIFYQKANQKQLINILKHELVHAWFCQQGSQAGHDERFRKKFKEVGGFGN